MQNYLLFIGAGIFLALLANYYYWLMRFESQHPWVTYHEFEHFEPQAFFDRVIAAVKERDIPEITIGYRYFTDTIIISNLRKYLRLSHENSVFYVCAAKIGTGMLISKWHCEKRELPIWHYVPFIAKMGGVNKQFKSFYQLDSEAVCRAVIDAAVTEAVQHFTAAKKIEGQREAQMAN
jgi:hypothetical protein